MLRKLPKFLLHWLLVGIAGLVIFFAVSISLVNIISPFLERYLPQFDRWASQVVKQPVKITNISATWYGFEPMIDFQGVRVLKKQSSLQLLKVHHLQIGINLWKSLFQRRIMTGIIRIVGAKLLIKQRPDNSIRINEIKSIYFKNSVKENMGNSKEFLTWLLSHKEIMLRKVKIDWYDKYGDHLSLHELNVKLINTLFEHKLQGSVTLAPNDETKLDFMIRARGNILKNSDARITFYIAANKIELSKWIGKYDIANMRISKGESDLQIWGKLVNKKLSDLYAEINAKQLKLTLGKEKKPFSIYDFGGKFYWQREINGWSLVGQKITLRTGHTIWPVDNFVYQVRKDKNNNINEQSFFVNYLNLTDVVPIILSVNILTKNQEAQLIAMQPRGKLRQLSFSVGRQGAAKWKITSKVEDLSFKHWKNWPSVKHLSGKIGLTPASGTMKLASKKLTIDWLKMFPKNLLLDQVSANINWQYDNNWKLMIKNADIKNENFALSGNMMLEKLASNDINIDLSAKLKGSGVHWIKAYLPLNMNKGLREWLSQAFVNGDGAWASVSLKGPLKHFPFVDRSGQFLVKSEFKNITLKYDKKWPSLQKLTGSLRFDNERMSFLVDTGNIANVALKDVSVGIANIVNPELMVNGKLESTWDKVSNFVKATPLNGRLGSRFKYINLKGPIKLGLNLKIPLKNNRGGKKNEVRGNIQFSNTLALLNKWKLEAENLNGKLDFTQDALFAKNIQGKLFNHPLSIDVNTIQLHKKINATRISLIGKISISDLSKKFYWPILDYISGQTSYQAIAELWAQDKRNYQRFTVASNLAGIAVKLPTPFDKRKKSMRTFRLIADSSQQRPLFVRIVYGDILNAALSFHGEKNRWNLYGGEMRLGGEKANYQNKAGVIVDGSLEYLSWPIWKRFFASYHKKQKRSEVGLMSIVNLKIDKLEVLGQEFMKNILTVVPAKEAWDVDLANPTIDGSLVIPSGKNKAEIIGNFKKLYLPEASKLKNKKTLYPKDIPAMEINCNDFHYGDKVLGKLILRTIPKKNYLGIDVFQLNSPAMFLKLSGAWRVFDEQQLTEIKGNLYSKNIGNVLKMWGTSSNLIGGNGNATLNLRWLGEPYHPDLNTLSGDIKLNFKDGRIVGISKKASEKIGLGRVLTLLSLQALPQRLALGFSDLTESGFSFNELKGDFKLTNGGVDTSNAYLDGPIAKVGIKGHIGLVKKNYNLQLRVLPYVTSSLPVIATIAGGPIAGVATWVADKLFSHEVQRITRHTYQVTGTWVKPQLLKIPEPKVNTKQMGELNHAN